MKWWWLILGSYLVASIPFGYLIGRARFGIDVRTLGSGNVGATNVMRTVGKLPGLCVLLLDMAKGTIPVLIVMVIGAPAEVVGSVALAAVCGHVFSIFLLFRGGKGVATAIGAYLPIAPSQALFVIAIFMVVLLWKRYVSMASMVAVASFPAVLLIANQTGWFPLIPVPIVVSATVSSFLIIVRHLENIYRLLSGKESRLEGPLEVRLK